MVTDPTTIRYHLEKAFYLATSGRPGPVWLDIPLDVQNAKIKSEDLIGFNKQEIDEPWRATDLDHASIEILSRLKTAKRPVIFAGGGCVCQEHIKSLSSLLISCACPLSAAGMRMT